MHEYQTSFLDVEAKLTSRVIKFPLKCLCILVMALLPADAVELPAKALAGLASQQFRDREIAQVELLAWARLTAPAMDELLRQSRLAVDPEVRERCLNVLRILVTEEYLKDGDGYLGIMLKDEVTDVPGEAKPRGVIRVLMVQPDSPAEHAGIRQNDMIVGINGEIWQDVTFRANIKKMKPNREVDLKILRDGGWMNFKVPLGRRPAFADNSFFPGQIYDLEAAERAAKEAYFRHWLSLRKLPK